MADVDSLSSMGDNPDWDISVADKTRVVFPLVNVAKGYLMSQSEIDVVGDKNIVFVEEDNDDLRDIPIDRGWAWMVVVASFGMHTLVVGAMKSFGILFVEFKEKYNVSARELGTVQGIAMTLMFGLGLGANLLAVQFTGQKVVFAGGFLTAVGFILSAYVTRFEFLYLTYGVITGFGFALSYSPCVVMVGHHFRKRRSLANGISVSGSGVGSMILPILMRWMLNEYCLSGCLLLLGGLMLNVCGCALLLRPASSYRRITQPFDKKFQQTDPNCQQLMEMNKTDLVSGTPDSSSHSVDNGHRQTAGLSHRTRSGSQSLNVTAGLLQKTKTASRSLEIQTFASNGDITMTPLEHMSEEEMKFLTSGLCSNITGICFKRKTKSSEGSKRSKLFDWSLLSNPLFLIYALSSGLAYFSYPNIFFMLPAFSESNGQDRDTAALLVSIVGITDLAGRVFFGWFSDLSCIPRRYGFIGGLIITGVLNLVAPAMTSFEGMAVYAALYGFFAGSFFALISVMLVEALGVEQLSNSYGLTTFAMSVGLLPGPLICGEILDKTSKWDLAFVLCGVLTLMASVPPMFEPCARRYVDAKVQRTQGNTRAMQNIQLSDHTV